MDKFERLQQFMDSTEEHLYPEPPAEPQISITTQMVDLIAKLDFTTPGKKLLDVGCGQGLALELLQAAGLDVTGVTLGDEDVKVCQEKGLNVRQMDQSFLEFGDGEFDLIWSRHALEHSFFPMFTLWGFHRVLKEGGLLYVEVPAPDTDCHHESNRNHYSVLGKSMWLNLFNRTKFETIENWDFKFTVPAGPDLYWGFLLRRIDYQKVPSPAPYSEEPDKT